MPRLDEIALRYHIARERVRQLLREHERLTTGQTRSDKAITAVAKEARAARLLTLTQAHAPQIIAAWRAGEEPQQIAVRFGLGRRRVEQVIREQAKPEDRAARAQSRRSTNACPAQNHLPCS